MQMHLLHKNNSSNSFFYQQTNFPASSIPDLSISRDFPPLIHSCSLQGFSPETYAASRAHCIAIYTHSIRSVQREATGDWPFGAHNRRPT